MTPLDAALAALPDNLDAFDAAKARAMVQGYAVEWDDRAVEVLAVECEFAHPLYDDLGLEHPHWLRGGKIDLVIRDESGAVVVIDHKTSSEDVGAGSTYRKRLILNGQASQYMHAAGTMFGCEPDRFCFDVLCKPRIAPIKATPVESRKYTAEKWVKHPDCKGKGCSGCTDGKTMAEPSRLYAGQRTEDETPLEYERRVLVAMQEAPDAFFARIDITRSEAELADHTRAIAADALLMDIVRERRIDGPNDDACLKYGSPCEFWDVCTGTASLDDPTRFVRREHVHDELVTLVPKGKRLLTNSRRQTFNACRRKHRIAYDDGYRAVETAWNLMFGDAVHKALEAYWNARRHGAARAA